jgi:VWFA-related protein
LEVVSGLEVKGAVIMPIDVARSLRCLAVLLIVSATGVSQQELPSSSPSTQAAASQNPALDTASGQQPASTLRVTTRLVLVDVVALDHKGLPVTDLKADDFSLREEGSEQKVRVFSFQQPGTAESGSDAAKAQPVKLPPNMFTNVPTYKADRTLSVILLDGLNVDLANQKFMRQEMIKYLAKLPAGQPVAVYALGLKLRLLQDFTTDPSLLKQAIQNSKGHPSQVMENPATGQASPYLAGAASAALSEMGLQSMLNQIMLYQQENIAAQTDLRVSLTMNALKALARTLAGYPGRKNLIWVTSAFPAQIFTTLSVTSDAITSTRSGGPVLSNYSLEIERISNELSNARVAVYPVDTRGVVNHDVYSSLSNTDSTGNYLGRTATGQVAGSALDQRGAMGRELDRTPDDQLATHSTMNSVAEQTGGKAFYNTNNLDEAIRDGIQDGGTYYTLGYYPENKDWNGKLRKLVVNVKRSGVKLRYRQGYFAVNPTGYTKLDAKIQAADLSQAMSLDYPASTALQFRAVPIPSQDSAVNKITINFGVDAHNLGFESQEDGLQRASVDCAAQAFTLKGESVAARASTFAIALKPEQYQLVMQKFLPCNQTLELPPGEYVLRLGVRDNSTGLIGTTNARVTVPLPSPGSTQNGQRKQ